MPFEADRVLVTGGAGFVGSCLVHRLLEQTNARRVLVLDDLRNGHRDHLPHSDRIELHELDLTDADGVRKVILDARPQVIFHLAALHFIPYCNAHPAQTLEVNVVGTQNLLEACRRAEPIILVVASTGAVYPIRDGANREDDSVGPMDIYGLSKTFNEMQLELYARESSTRCAVARLFNIYGPGETNPHVIPEIVEQVARGREQIELGNVKPKRDYIYVADVADALMAIAAESRSPYRVYNVGTGEEYSVEEIVGLLEKIAGRPIRISVAADRVRSVDRMHLLCDRSRIGREIGWSPHYTFERGLTELWESGCRDAAGAPDEPEGAEAEIFTTGTR